MQITILLFKVWRSSWAHKSADSIFCGLQLHSSQVGPKSHQNHTQH